MCKITEGKLDLILQKITKVEVSQAKTETDVSYIKSELLDAKVDIKENADSIKHNTSYLNKAILGYEWVSEL